MLKRCDLFGDKTALSRPKSGRDGYVFRVLKEIKYSLLRNIYKNLHSDITSLYKLLETRRLNYLWARAGRQLPNDRVKVEHAQTRDLT